MSAIISLGKYGRGAGAHAADQLGPTTHFHSRSQRCGEDNAHAPVLEIEWM